jgi:glycogen synthase
VHVLITTDTLSGVWTYTQELVTGLAHRGVRVTLVSFGDIPLSSQTSWMDKLDGLDYRPTAFCLDWMQEGKRDFEESSRYLTALAREVKPDLLHLNHLCHGALPVDVQRIVTAHGDLITRSIAVQGTEPKSSRWLHWYRETLARGIAEANVLVASSRWMLNMIEECYAQPASTAVVHHGRNPIFFNPYVSKNDYALAIGRLVDAGKQVSLLTQHPLHLPVCIVECDERPSGIEGLISAGVKVDLDAANISVKGKQTDAQMRMLYSRAAMFVATSRYEALGFPVLEAALSRCAIVANDTPFFREIWGDAAIYFEANDAESLSYVMRRLHEQRDLCRGYGARAFQRARECFTAQRMVENYLQLYRRTLTGEAVAA